MRMNVTSLLVSAQLASPLTFLNLMMNVVDRTCNSKEQQHIEIGLNAHVVILREAPQSSTDSACRHAVLIEDKVFKPSALTRDVATKARS
mmetsp:Transcript_98014/g.194015  ORF Transcript_98014/g.194015 Transcript_98014/m.194015 type:complete len:90 (-) Transcript_98014:1088-1357(-)